MSGRTASPEKGILPRVILVVTLRFALLFAFISSALSAEVTTWKRQGATFRLSYEAATMDQGSSRLTLRRNEKDARIEVASGSWEYVNAQEGLGQLIANARRMAATDQVFAGIIVIIGVALLTYQSLMWLKRRFFRWETKA